MSKHYLGTTSQTNQIHPCSCRLGLTEPVGKQLVEDKLTNTSMLLPERIRHWQHIH